MRRSSLAVVAMAALGVIGTASYSQAAVNIYYIEATVDSSWIAQYDSGSGVVTSDWHYPTADPISSTFGSDSNPDFLAGTWSFLDQVSLIDSRDDNHGHPLGGSYARGEGTISAVVSGDLFSVSGSIGGSTELDTASDALIVQAEAVSKFTMNFLVPADAPYKLTLNGFTTTDGYGLVTFRIANDVLGNLVDVEGDYNWSDAEFDLPAGSLVQIDIFASTDQYAYSDTDFPEPWTVGASFDISGTLTPIPEPTSVGLGIVIALGGLGARRRSKVIAR